MGDVIGALPKSLVKNGHEVAVILPYYDVVSAKFGDQVEDLGFFYTNVGRRRQYVGIKKIVRDGVTFFFIDNEQYFNRGTVYGEWDDGERFGFFQMAALELMEKVDFIPDILHVHDYHTAMIPIHNIEFQGQFDSGMLWEIFGVGYERYADGTLRWNDCLNWMKAAVLYADRVTTVSPSYASEIQTPEFGKGLDQIMRMESGKLSGIVNGIDTDLLDPETDAHIPYHFSVDDLSGKAKDKAALQERVGLPVREDVPLIGIVSRLTQHLAT